MFTPFINSMSFISTISQTRPKKYSTQDKMSLNIELFHLGALSGGEGGGESFIFLPQCDSVLDESLFALLCAVISWLHNFPPQKQVCCCRIFVAFGGAFSSWLGRWRIVVWTYTCTLAILLSCSLCMLIHCRKFRKEKMISLSNTLIFLHSENLK